MRFFSKLSLGLISLVAFAGCTSEFKHPDTSNCEKSLTVIPFYKDLMESGNGDMSSLNNSLLAKYGKFYTNFCEQELRIGTPGTTMCDSILVRFLSQPENAEVISLCDSVYSKIDVNSEVSDAFSCFAALFPSLPVPEQVLCHFSFFNSRILVDSTYISFGIENYLGSDCRFYEWLDIPVYARQNRETKWIVTDLIKAWVLSTMPEQSDKDDILTALIYQAKVLYATHCCLPNIDDATLFGMTDEQLKWCEEYEANMWGALVENKLLYSTNVLDRNKLVNEAPFTFFFGNNSPGRAAFYCAYNIVRGYMKNHSDVTPQMLMDIKDAQSILQGSKYSPK